MSDTAAQQESEKAKTPKLEIQKIYLKDSSWEAPGSPDTFQQPWKPEMNIEIRNQVRRHDNNLYEVTLHINITCRNQKKIAFVVELEQAGLFLIENIGDQECERIIGTICPNTIFPYARENIDNLTIKGGFAPVQLAPVNFDALYAQAMERKKQKQQKKETTAARITH